MTAQDIIDALQTEARAHETRLRAKGVALVKKRLRYNDAVEVGIFYGRLGERFCLGAALAGVREAVDACVAGDVAEIDGSLLAMIHPWMATAQDPRKEAAK